MSQLLQYKSRAVRAMVLLLEAELRRFVTLWSEAKQNGLTINIPDDEDYLSMEHLLRHVLRAARGEINWICKCLNMPDPQVLPTPDVHQIEYELETYLEHLLEKWRVNMADITDEQLGPQTYKSNWKWDYHIDSMLEHSVMHPIRHTFQLNEFMEKFAKGKSK